MDFQLLAKGIALAAVSYTHLDVYKRQPVMDVIKKDYPNVSKENLGVGSTIFAVKPGDGLSLIHICFHYIRNRNM